MAAPYQGCVQVVRRSVDSAGAGVHACRGEEPVRVGAGAHSRRQKVEPLWETENTREARDLSRLTTSHGELPCLRWGPGLRIRRNTATCPV